jgi:hypothetical protein
VDLRLIHALTPVEAPAHRIAAARGPLARHAIVTEPMRVAQWSVGWCISHRIGHHVAVRIVLFTRRVARELGAELHFRAGRREAPSTECSLNSPRVISPRSVRSLDR